MSKIKAIIRNIGDMIRWESDNVTVGPIATAAKQSLLRLILYFMPIDSDQAFPYHLILEHGDFGIHNMSIIIDANGFFIPLSIFCMIPTTSHRRI
jgi:hypothetical protein